MVRHANRFLAGLAGFVIVASVLMPWGQLSLRAETGPEGDPSCCGMCGAPCAPCRLVECTIMVPMQVTVVRMQPSVVTTTEEREETYTVFQRVPETRQIKREYCYLEDEVHTKTITEKKCHLVQNPAVRTCKVEVPERQIRHECVADEACPACGCDEASCAEPRQCEVIVPRVEEQTQCFEAPDVVFSTNKRQIDYCVKVPKKKVEVCAEERICKLVPVEKTRTVTVCVPKIVHKPVEVTVTKMMPKKVVCCQSCCQGH